MPVFRDGYSIPFQTDAKLVNSVTGETVYDNLPVIRGKYRPPTYDERERFIYNLNSATSGEGRARVIKEFIAAHVAEWDASYLPSPGGRETPIPTNDVDLIGRFVPEVIVNNLLSICCKWGPGASQEKDAGNS
jgi:hypothetical protein